MSVKDKPSMTGASAKVDHKPADYLPGIKFVNMEGKKTKVRTKPTTSMTAKKLH
jgi:hypothetical protein